MIKADMQLRWFTTANFIITKELKVALYQVQISSEHKKQQVKVAF